jgi:hypothetical protein
MRGVVAELYPNATIYGEYVFIDKNSEWPEVLMSSIKFLFPGSKYFGAELSFGEGWGRSRRGISLYIPEGDRMAWRAWLAAGCPADMPCSRFVSS